MRSVNHAEAESRAEAPFSPSLASDSKSEESRRDRGGGGPGGTHPDVEGCGGTSNPEEVAEPDGQSHAERQREASVAEHGLTAPAVEP